MNHLNNIVYSLSNDGVIINYHIVKIRFYAYKHGWNDYFSNSEAQSLEYKHKQPLDGCFMRCTLRSDLASESR